jgi:hypothetical protein
VFLIPAFTTLISLAFAGQVLNQYRSRGKAHQLAWGLALIFYAVAAFPEVVGSISGWNEAEFRVYYLFGAILLVPWLSLGTAELLAPAGVRQGYRVFVLGISVLGLATVALAPLHGSFFAGDQVPSNCTMWCKSGGSYELSNGLAALSAGVGNAVGTVVLVGGALWSAYRAYRAGLARGIFYGQIFIAAGAFLVAGIATLTRTPGYYGLFYAGQAAGIAIIFGGFLMIGSAARVRSQVAST